MLLLPSAKEATGKKMPNKRDNNNGRRNRFILTPCSEVKYPNFSVMPYPKFGYFYHADFLKAICFLKDSELQIAFPCKSGYG